MPQHVARDVLPLAVSQNCKVWGTAAPDPAFPAIAFEQAAHAAQAAWLADRRTRLIDRIDDATDAPTSFHHSAYFRLLGGGLALSADEATDELRQLLRREIDRCRRRHWSASPQRVAALQEALTFARYFRRFGARVWMRQAA
jgi:hypothetical protein